MPVTSTKNTLHISPPCGKKPPFALGYALISLVEKSGEGVTKFTIGQKVVVLTEIAAYTECIFLQKSRLTLVPDELEQMETVRLIAMKKVVGKFSGVKFLNKATGPSVRQFSG